MIDNLPEMAKYYSNVLEVMSVIRAKGLEKTLEELKMMEDALLSGKDRIMQDKIAVLRWDIAMTTIECIRAERKARGL